jgi:mono/diheme cytochrome c family protein
LAKNLTPKPADLVEHAARHSDGDFVWKITNGRGTMPGFKDQLTQNQILDVTNFIKSLK